ncbi:MAG: PAS domain S-box protein [Candidatus Marinimicrobia bacterium]|nr:PAS domain S-box protein [Candidatus Neomarinimicrobiota bacterium]
MQAEDELRQSEVNFRNIFNLSSDAIFIKDQDLTIIDVNESAEKLFDYSHEELLARPEQTLGDKSKNDYTMADKYIKKALEGIPQRFEWWGLKKDGTSFPEEILINKTVYDGEDVLLFTIRDIAERKQVEGALKESEERYRTLVESAPVGIISIDTKGNITSVNPKILEILGSPKAEATMSFNMFKFKPLQESGISSIFKSVLESGNPIQTEVEYTSKWGKTAFLSYYVVAIHGVDKKVIGAQAIVEDVTESKQAQEKLYKQSIIQAKLLNTARLLPASLDLLKVLDRIARQALELLDAYGCIIFQLENDGKTLIPMIAIEPDLEETVLSMKLDIDSCLTGQAIIAKQGKIFNSAGNNPKAHQIPGTPVVKDEHLIVSPFIVDDTVLGAMSLNRIGTIFTKEELMLAEAFANYASITLKNANIHHNLLNEVAERKQAEAALQDSHQLKDMLLDIMSHDLKNPSGVISSASEVLLEEFSDNELLGIIKDSSDSLFDVIDKTTLLAQIAVGDKIDFQEINVTDLFQKLSKDFKVMLNSSEIVMKIDIPDNLTIMSNPIISEVFYNYISNAIKYAPMGKRILVDSEKGDEYLTINVKDFGSIIPKSNREEIFSRNVRLKGDKNRGRGLGLAIVTKIAEAHNAEVGVKPNEPTGNIFYIKIPLK